MPRLLEEIKPRVRKVIRSFSLDEDIVEWLEEEAKKRNMSVSGLVNEILRRVKEEVC